MRRLKADGRRVYIQHGQPGPGVLRKFLRAKSSSFVPMPLPRADCVTNRWPIPRFMADTHHAVRRIRSGVQENAQPPCASSSGRWRMASGVYSARPASVHTPRQTVRQPSANSFAAASSWAPVLISWARSVRFQRGIWVIGWVALPLVIQVRAALAGAFPALAAAPASILLWSPVSSTGGMAWPSHTSGAGELGYSSRPSQ